MMPASMSAAAAQKAVRPYQQYPMPRPENFISILYNILEHHNYWCLHWNEEGTEIVIECPESVAREVLPHHFNTMKYQSFTRQFHLYRFRRIADGRRDKKYKGYCRFFHQDFLRDHPHLISSITRVKVSKTSAAARKERREKAAKSAKTKTKAMAKTEAAAKSTQTHSRAVSVSTKPPSASAPVSHGGTVSPAALLMQSDGLSSPELEQTAPEFNTPVARDAIKSLQVLEDVFEELDLQVLHFLREQLDVVCEMISTKIASTVTEDPPTAYYLSELPKGTAMPTKPAELAGMSTCSAQSLAKRPNAELYVSGVSPSSLLATDELSTAIQTFTKQPPVPVSQSKAAPSAVPSQSSIAHVASSLSALGFNSNLVPIQLNCGGAFFSPTTSQIDSGTYEPIPVTNVGFGVGPMSNPAMANGFAGSTNPNTLQGLGIAFPTSAPAALHMHTISNTPYLLSTSPMKGTHPGMTAPLWSAPADQPGMADSIHSIPSNS